MFKNSKIKSIIVTLFLIVIFFIFGIYIGFYNQPSINKIVSITNKENSVGILSDFSPFWKAWKIIDEKYPNAKEIDDQNRIYGAISGLVSSLNDPYSSFFNPEETKSFEEDISGSFGGIGVEVDIKDKILTIIAPLKDTPGYKAGLKSGDKIFKINETLTADLSIEKAITLMRGERGTLVTLTLFREGEEETREIEIIRDIINVPILKTELRKDDIFVITLNSFSENSAQLFNEAIKEFKDTKKNKLLLDLRGNPGGYLDSAVSIASWFLPSGKTVVIEDYSNNKKQKIYRSEVYNVFNEKLKFIILIDNGSASASEILAGAMQDYGIAKIVGEQSYGKGSVQEIVSLTPETILKITVAKWLTPKGTSISEKGLIPDYEIKFTEEDEKNEKDPQLEKAVELLNN
jgi:carboxyl-terminal processing protease